MNGPNFCQYDLNKEKTIEASSAANESFLPRIFESLER